MARFEYKVVPAPTRGRKARAVKGAEGRFAHGIELLMNEMAAEGWEYQRAETLPSEERSGIASTQTVWRNLLVFRRPLTAAAGEGPDAAAEDDAAGKTPDTATPEATLDGRRLTSAAELASDAPSRGATDSGLSAAPAEPSPFDDSDGPGLEPDRPIGILADRAARLRQSQAAE